MILYPFLRRIINYVSGAILVAVFLLPTTLLAQEGRSYSYDLFDATIRVNEDSTVDIEEQQVFNFVGEYHEGWRTVPFKDISTISHIEVIDGETGVPLTYSSSQLDKTNPTSWGKYTYTSGGGGRNIIWYYDAESETKEWIVKYKVHGGINFLDNHDEFYWNLFTDFTVPIREARATVLIPEHEHGADTLSVSIYAQHASYESAEIIDNRTFEFGATNIAPQGIVTIAAGWPKNIVPQSAFWRDWLNLYWGFIASVFAVVLAIVVGIVRWYIREKWNQGRGTIVPHYEPPQNLTPAVMGYILNEWVHSKTWPATIVDLAVRGYVSIEEEEPGAFQVWFENTFTKRRVVICIVALLVLITFLSLFVSPVVVIVLAFVVPFAIIIIVASAVKDYKVLKAKDGDSGLEDYEKKFLDVIFGGRSYMSTKELKSASHSEKQRLYKEMQRLQKEFKIETKNSTRVYEVGVTKKGTLALYVIVPFIVAVLLSLFGPFAFSWQSGLFVGVSMLSGFVLYLFERFNPRLNKEGQILKEEILGFKMYLETAERYRMQNLTPEIFERYLPYAMIFGIEKKWAHAFEGIVTAPPDWYHGNAAVYSGSVASTQFSSSAFSSSFSSSFSSAFSSSGASGASGGGGGAGGGGGGGGGGAS